MESVLPVWAVDLGTISSIIGLPISIWVLIEARKIKNSFLRKARLPETISDLEKIITQISKLLKRWEIESREIIHQFMMAKRILENLKTKLPEREKKLVSEFTKTLETRKLLIFRSRIVTAEEDKAWALYSELSCLIMSLQQLQKDSKWD